MTVLEKRPGLLPELFTGFFDDDRFLNFDFRNKWPARVPAANVFEKEDSFIIHLAAPGMKKEDFHIDMEDRTLWIKVKVENEIYENEDLYTRMEFNYREFNRSFIVPENVNNELIKAKYEDGILKLLLPKLELEKRLPKQEITIM